MVAAECDAGTADCCVVIRPNCSLSWRRAVTVFCGISLVSLTIALGFSLLGYWLILPYSLLEMSAEFDAPLGTIKRRLHVARKRLAKAVAPMAV